MDERTGRRLRVNAVEIASTVVTGTWLALLFLAPGNLWLAALLFGYIVVVPVVAMLYGDEEDREEWVDSYDEAESVDNSSADDGSDALETLRDRYARGELTDDQFERKLDLLLETESLEDVEDRQQRREREVEFER